MNTKINNFINIFKEIANIPHPSGNTSQLRKFLSEYASNLGYQVLDDGKNLIITMPATPGCQNLEPIILQGHLDMVALSKSGYSHDFNNQGLDIRITPDKKYLYAEKTSLGGDDGIAIAFMLLLMKEDNFAHPTLYLVLTDDEELGCIGAKELDFHVIEDAKYMINLDVEQEGVLPLSSARCETITALNHFDTQESLGDVWYISIKFPGDGHPSISVDQNVGHLINLLAQILLHLYFTTNTRLISLNTADRAGTLPVHAHALVLTTTNDEEFLDQLKFIRSTISKAYEGLTDGPIFTVPVKLGLQRTQAYTPSASSIIGQIQMFAPNGVFIKEDNNIIASIAIKECAVDVNSSKIVYQLRGKNSDVIELMKNRLMLFYNNAETYFSSILDAYDWQADENSPLQYKAKSVWENFTGTDLKTIPYMHGFTETGIFKKNLPGLDIISIGSTVKNIHTADEKLDLESAVLVYEYLKKLIEDFTVKEDFDLVEEESPKTMIERTNGQIESIQSFYDSRNNTDDSLVNPDCESCTTDCPFKN